MLLLIAAGCLTLALAGMASAAYGSPGGIWLTVTSVACFIWVYLIDKRRVARKAEAIVEKNKARVEDIASSITSPTFCMELSGSSGLLWWLLALGFAVALFFAGFSRSPILAGVGAVLGLLASLLLLDAVSALGKPVLRVMHNAIQLPASPVIPWSAVEGIHLQAHSHRGMHLFHTLVFLVPSLADEAHKFAWSFRLTYALRPGSGKQRLVVILKDTNEAPEVIYEVTRRLWGKRTGRHHDWNPNMSAEFNRALRVSSDAAGRLHSCGLADVAAANEAIRTIAASNEVIDRELRPKIRLFNWLIAVPTIALAVYLAAWIVKRGMA